MVHSRISFMNPPIYRRLLAPETILFLCFWPIALYLLQSRAFLDPGALWHVRVGDWIFEHQAFPHTDPFTWSYQGHHWIPQQWGAECLMSLMHRVSKLDTLLLATATFLASFTAWVGKRFVAGGMHLLPAGLLAGFGMAVAGFHFYTRPHLVSIPLMGVIIAFIVDLERARISLRRWLWLIPLCIVWTNLHGGALGGICTLGLAVTGWSLYSLVGYPTPVWNFPRFTSLAGIVLLCAMTPLVNPFGLDLLRTWWSLIDFPFLKEVVDEHMPLSLAKSQGQAVVGFAVFYGLMLAGTFPRMPKVSSLLPLVWFILSLTSVRHGAIFAVTALVALTDFLPETCWYRWLKKSGDTFFRDPRPDIMRFSPTAWLLSTILVLIALGLQAMGIAVPLIGRGSAHLDEKVIPVGMIGPLQNYARERPDGFPIFNDANLGGFLLYFTPSLQIFMDDRCELYGDEGMRNYVNMLDDHPEWIDEVWSSRAPFDRAFVRRSTKDEPSKMDEYLKNSPLWREVATVGRGVLYERLP